MLHKDLRLKRCNSEGTEWEIVNKIKDQRNDARGNNNNEAEMIIDNFVNKMTSKNWIFI